MRRHAQLLILGVRRRGIGDVISHAGVQSARQARQKLILAGLGGQDAAGGGVKLGAWGGNGAYHVTTPNKG